MNIQTESEILTNDQVYAFLESLVDLPILELEDALTDLEKKTGKKKNVLYKALAEIRGSRTSNSESSTEYFNYHQLMSSDLWFQLDDEGNPKPIIQNIQRLIKHYRLQVVYNCINRTIHINVPGERIDKGNEFNDGFTLIHSLLTNNKMSITNHTLKSYLHYIALGNKYNPIKEYIASKPWDGVSRLPDYYDTVESDSNNKELYMRKWLLSAVAAITSVKEFRTRGTLVFQGEESLGKGEWFKSLLPEELRNYLLTGAYIDTKDKDTQIRALSHWMVELAELGTTLSKSDNCRLKAFLTNSKDSIRAPYAASDTIFRRQTVFFASVNESTFLKDDAGNTRWYIVPVRKINYQHNIDMQQLYAEAFTLLQSGESWWLSSEEEQALISGNKAFTEICPFEDLLKTRYDFSKPLVRGITATELLIELNYLQPTKSLRNAVSRVLRNLGAKLDRQGKYLLPMPEAVYRYAPPEESHCNTQAEVLPPPPPSTPRTITENSFTLVDRNSGNRDQIDLIRTRINLQDYVDNHVTLKHNMGLCPFHNEKTPSFSVRPEFFKCFGCNAKGDIYDYIAMHKNLSLADNFPQILAIAAEYAGVELENRQYSVTYTEDPQAILERNKRWEREKAETLAKYELEKEQSRQLAKSIYESGIYIDAPYLSKRCGTKVITPPGFRFLKEYYHTEEKKNYPVMIAGLVRDGNFTGVHLTFLDKNGEKKADIKPNKKFIGISKGSHIPLYHTYDGDTLIIAEGIETGMSAWNIITGKDDLVACFAAGAGYNMAELSIPAKFTKIIIAGDNGEAGKNYAEAARQIYEKQGFKVSNVYPPEKFGDFNDWELFNNKNNI
jgi:hypothetical protein